jgi:hypothetical protein
MYFQRVISQKKTLKKKFFFFASCQPLTKKTGSGSVGQWYSSADPDPYRTKMSRIHNNAFHSHAYPDPAPNQSDTNLGPLVYRPSTALF